MASSYTNVYSYADPVQLDISNTLGKAVTYKQQQYDTNTTAIQQLVNQYAGVDLARSIDEQYLGERLGTLVNYVNQAGAMDWSRKSIYNDVSNYIGQALDSNVMAAVGSTQARRKQQAEIEDIKKNKPELYATQNEYLATLDWGRYMNSNQLGDNYRPGSYMPYTDTNKLMLDMAAKAKDFGMETYTDDDGGIMFRTINKHEVLSKAKAQEIVDLALGAKGKQQLQIDGIYKYKDYSKDDLTKIYNDKLDHTVDNYTQSEKALRLKAASSPTEIKNRLLQEADSYAKMATDVKLQKADTSKMDSMTLAGNINMNAFIDKWTDLMAYDRVTSTNRDDSGFQLMKFNADREFRIADLELKKKKLESDLLVAGQKLDKDGNIIKDPNATINASTDGVTVIQQDKKQEEVESTPITQVYADYDIAWGNAMKEGTAGIMKVMNDPANTQLKKELGFENRDAKYIVNSFIVDPNRYSKIMNHLDSNTQDLIYQANSAYKAKQDIQVNSKAISDNITRFSNAMYATPDSPTSIKRNFNLYQGGLGIDEHGNLVKRDVRYNNTENDRKVREIGVINNQLRTGSNLDDDTRALLYHKQMDIVNSMKLTPKQRQAAIDNLIVNDKNNLNVVGQIATALFSPLLAVAGGVATLGEEIYNMANYDNPKAKTNAISDWIGDKLNRTYGAGALFDMNHQSSNKSTLMSRAFDNIDGIFTPNEKISSIGNSDIKGIVNASEFDDRLRGDIQRVKQHAIDVKANTQFHNTINIDLSKKAGDSVISSIKAWLPIGSEIQKDGKAIYEVDINKGTGKMTVPVKDGKDIVPVEVEIPLSQLPSSITSMIDTNKNNNLYSATNPYSPGFSAYAEIPATRKEWLSQVDTMPVWQRTQAVNNPPITQEDIMKNLEIQFGKQLLQDNRKEINEIMKIPPLYNYVQENGQWTIVGKQGNEVIYRQPTGLPNFDRSVVGDKINALNTEVILQNLKALLISKQQ
ncbi:MAG: hypothetical protein LBM02_10130 [Lachnospiraceae bacterium]|jgi:hypothetical protein|nr:hypothetical protein [Lachnospiraceae bacterium]